MGRRQIALAIALLSLSSTLCLRLLKKVGEKMEREQRRKEEQR